MTARRSSVDYLEDIRGAGREVMTFSLRRNLPNSWSFAMLMTLTIDPSADLARYRLPAAVATRLQWLLDRQDAGQPLSVDERAEAEGLADLADMLTLLRLRAEREAA